jgi:hypothetical protein
MFLFLCWMGCAAHSLPTTGYLESGRDFAFRAMLSRASYPQQLGERLSWQDSVPDAYLPERFYGVIDEALVSCRLGVRLIGVDCTEPLCIALFEFTDLWRYHSDKLGECSAWTSVYGDTFTLVSTSVDCPARKRSIIAIAPYLDDRYKRVMQREKIIVDAWDCSL